MLGRAVLPTIIGQGYRMLRVNAIGCLGHPPNHFNAIFEKSHNCDILNTCRWLCLKHEIV